MASATPSHSSDLRIVLLGKNRAEISTIGNMILGRRAFKEKSRVSEVQRGRVEDRNISVIDTPGFFNTELTDEDLHNEMMKSLSLSHPGPHVFLLTVNPDTFTEDDVRKIVKKIEKNFGAHVLKFTLVLFIREHMSNREWMVVTLSKIYQDLISHFRGKYHVINTDNDTTEITTLVEKLDEVVSQNDDQHYSNENYVMFPAVRNQERRVKVLAAKTNIMSGAVAKNATSNSIPGNNLFKEEIPSDVSHHSIEHDTYEMYRETFRKLVEKKENERDELRRTEEPKSREKTRRIREEEVKNREEELKTREDEQRKKVEREPKKREEELGTREDEHRKKEEIENLKWIYAEMRMTELVRTMSPRRRAEVLEALIASRYTKDHDKDGKQFMYKNVKK